MASYTDITGAASSGKLSKTRSKPVVKPILKKLSHSEKNSLDLDRGWDEQQTTFGHYGGSLGREREGSFGGRDVSFSISATELSHSSSIGNGRSNFSHARSTSGTSHVSVATSGSGHRNGGSFVHPFQQTPRTSTPPLSYANSLASIEHGGSSSNSNSNSNANPGATGPRDYSPTITEDDDDDLLDQHYLHHRSNYHTAVSSSIPITSNPSSSSYPRRPSLASRTSSLSDINNHTGPPSLRINTSRTNSNAASSRLAHVSSHSDIKHSGRVSDSTVSNTAPVLSPLSSASPSTSVTAMSPLRTSLEGFRLRSRSDLDSNYHQERIRLERHRWEEKERLKNEKRDKEEMRKRERADIKEALRHEREQQLMMKREAKEAARKQSFSHSARNSSSDIIRPSISRKRTAPDAEKLAMGAAENRGGVGFASRNYESTDQGQAPVADEVMFEGPRRSLTAKRKTQGAWTSFVLWFRTRILRLHDNMAKK
ncbi:uncharacterized protein LY79DRAFT_131050 [Colletotrichum navitas]|uniref:Uncharacterized protein n=1 Tax=Colletotrichum navitas TaxID=681940 RepID=A0AAD8Q2H6_9PEZI|nr:uncharacterized protein LY79DRAFT_131050 [Colletotrichum navitas]KAK1594518.1 hypothetical protein LY79DRAFT_131050 [Colletotrichum navitas]